MKETIQNLLQKDDITIQELLECVEEIKEQGNTVVVKLDGGRQSNQYTIFITFPVQQNKKMIRADTSTLISGLKAVLRLYVEEV